VAARTQARRISHARPARGRKSANPDSPRQRPTDKYPAIANAIARLPAQNGYIDGELRGVLPDGRTAFNLIQNATDTGEGSLVFFLFDLLHLDGENLMAPLLIERNARLASLLNAAPDCLRYNDHQIGRARSNGELLAITPSLRPSRHGSSAPKPKYSLRTRSRPFSMRCAAGRSILSS
jgi:hypothetical protein